MGIILQKRLFFLAGCLLFIINGLLLGGAHAKHAKYYDYVLKETNFTRLCSTKSMLTTNGMFPGPVIRVHKGETIYINVLNQGLYGVTVHWHGVKQPRNPWSDGPENVTQCPIKPGSNFTYEINFSSEEGTLWWHAHSDWTRATVHGAIIVYPATGKTYPFAKPYAEETIVLASWFKGDVMEIITEALENGGEPNVSDAFTINGQPGDLYPCSNASTFRLLVNYGKTYLLRIVNAVMNEEMFFAVAGHSLTLVGADGAYVKPFKTSYIMITPGQTMDVLLTADQPLSHYYMAALAYSSGISAYDNTTTTAIVQYKGNYTPPSSPSFPSNLPAYDNGSAASNFTSQVRSLASKEHPISVPQKVTKRIMITVSVNNKICPNASCSGPDGNRLSSSLNNISFVLPSVDILQAYYWNITGVFNRTFPSRPPRFFDFTADDTGNDTLVPEDGTRVKMINYNESVEIVYQGTNVANSSENHPMHLHGFSFYVVGTGAGNFNASIHNPQKYYNYNLVDPPEVNTIGVPKNGWVAIRFVADNPGVWFMHCHLERHTSWGMETVLIVKNGTTAATSIRSPPSYMPPCS